MEMNKGSFKYRNDHKTYVKELFKDVPKAKGRLVAIGNGGYAVGNGTKLCPNFGYRVYFDKMKAMFHCQVISQVRDVKFGELLREYAVEQKENTSLDSVITAILYNEYVVRC